MSAGDGAQPTARDQLLAAVLERAREGGLADVSLRSLAASIGTSHRMLLYHFGSREGLVAAVVAAVEAGQRDVMTALAAAWADDPAGSALAVWADLADPALHEAERLFFEAVALALRGRPGTEGLRGTLVEPWLDAFAVAAGAAGLPQDEARADARVGIALTRGLLLDLLVTGDRAGVDAAMQRFVARYLGGSDARSQPMPNTAVRVTPTSADPVAIGTAVLAAESPEA